MRVKAVKETIKSIKHILGAWESAMSCFDENSNTNEALVRDLQEAINNDFERLFEGKPSLLKENHKKTRFERDICTG